VNAPLEAIHKSLSAFVEYRYTAATFEDADSSMSASIDYNASLIFGGVTWHFD
jgi:hypothetical protein